MRVTCPVVSMALLLNVDRNLRLVLLVLRWPREQSVLLAPRPGSSGDLAESGRTKSEKLLRGSCPDDHGGRNQLGVEASWVASGVGCTGRCNAPREGDLDRVARLQGGKCLSKVGP